eukprot:Nk52_evm18s327 gene=Nk52_evmTU18s327
MSESHILLLSLEDISSGLRAGTWTCVEIMEEAYTRIEMLAQPHLHGIVSLLGREEALLKARERDAGYEEEKKKNGGKISPFYGLPFSVKDNVHVKGFPTLNGVATSSPAPVKESASVVARLEALGGICIAKSNLPQMCRGMDCVNLLPVPGHRTVNPYGRGTGTRGGGEEECAYTVGGSSGGEGSLVSSGCTVIGVGNDRGGSVRIPAHFCGICGLKPTSGRVPLTGLVPGVVKGSLSANTFVLGPLGRWVGDVQAAFEAFRGSDGLDPMCVEPLPGQFDCPQSQCVSSLRACVVSGVSGAQPVSVRTQKTLKVTADVLRGCVSELDSVQVKAVDWLEMGELPALEECVRLMFALGSFDTIGVLDMLRANDVELSESFIAFSNLFEAYRPADFDSSSQDPLSALNSYRGLLKEWGNAEAEVCKFMRSYDMVVMPSYGSEAFRVSVEPGCKGDAHGGGHCEKEVIAHFAYTMLGSMIGYPCLTVRGDTLLKDTNWEGGEEPLPVGVQLMAKPYQENLLFTVGKVLEKAGAGYRPPRIVQ